MIFVECKYCNDSYCRMTLFDFLDNLCAVSRPAVTLLTVVKESRNAELRMNLLSCLEKVGICHCVSPDILVTSLLSRYVCLLCAWHVTKV